MHAGGAGADEQPLGDLVVGQALIDEVQDLDLAGGESSGASLAGQAVPTGRDLVELGLSAEPVGEVLGGVEGFVGLGAVGGGLGERR